MTEVIIPERDLWSTGDYRKIAWLTAPLGDVLCEAIELRQGARVLDVATGTGHVALASARRLCETSGIDCVPELVETAGARAAAEGLDVDFRVADAAALPYDDESYDVVLSAIGVMFAADHAGAVRELVRVTRPGGTIGLLNWRPEGQAARLFELVVRYAPPAPDAAPPPPWGTTVGVRDLFGDAVTDWRFGEGQLVERLASPAAWADFFLAHFGPLVAVASGLDDAGRAALRTDVVAFAEDGQEFDYLIAIGTRV